MLFLLLAACSDHKVTVNRQAPEVSLVAPAEGARYTSGEQVRFEAVVRDEDPLERLIYRWSSDLQGEVAGALELIEEQGLIRLSAELSEGTHTVTLDVTDSDGLRGTDAVGVVLLPPSDADSDSFDNEAAGGADCDDTDPGVYPGAAELCDGVDQDCDGAVDEGAEGDTPWYLDGDGDGYGDPQQLLSTCEQPEGAAPEAGDCNDGEPEIHPGAAELCDGLDQDCDSAVDEEAADAEIFYADSDGDGYGDPRAPVAACERPADHVDNDRDCSDADGAVSPDATEVCNDIDDDCDTQVDETGALDALTWYADDDLDGYGDAARSTAACDMPGGYTGDATDCDDADGAVHPGAEEICGDGVDSDCDGSAGACRITGELADSAADIILYGGGNNDEVGWVLAASGDVSHDGCADLAVGGPEAGDGSGELYLVAGCGGGGEGFLADAHAVILGAERGDAFGGSAAGGDLDGDGSSELLVGGAGADGLAEDQGAAWVFAGPVAGALDAADASQIIRADELAGALLGTALSAGDMDGDGVDDLLVTAPGAGSWDGAGSALVFLAPSGDLDAADADYVINGRGEGDGLGAAATLSADFDGDGLADLAVTAPDDTSAGAGAGALYVFLADRISGTHSASQAQGIYTGVERHDRVGLALAAGDLDSDGADELVLGAPEVDVPDTNSGAAYVIAGGATGTFSLDDAGAVLATVRGLDANEAVGQALACGDVDGDGAHDLLIGGYGAAADTGHTYGGWAGLFYGLPLGELDLQDADWLIASGDAYSRVGAGAALPGDLGGDGAADLALGAPYADGGGSNAGEVLVFFGGGL